MVPNITKILVFIFILLLYSMPFDANAARKRYVNSGGDITQSPRYASIVVNANTGEVLSKYNENKPLHPASLTKMMTIYLAFQAIEKHALHLNQQVPVSAHAASKPPTRLNLKAGQTISVKDALLGMIIHSANDASVVIAEAIDGSEEAFAERMTRTARQLGMSNTTFMNAHGLHHLEQITTAADMAKLGIALRRDYPKYYPLFSKKSFIFRGNVITSHNRVMNRYTWADGLKTGFISASGFNLVSSASKPEGRIVAVVLGGHSARARDDHMIALLDRGFNKIAGKQPKTAIAEAEQVQSKTEVAQTLTRTGPTAFDVAEAQIFANHPMQQSMHMVADSVVTEAIAEEGSSTFDIEGIEDDLDKPLSSLSPLPQKPVLRSAPSEPIVVSKPQVVHPQSQPSIKTKGKVKEKLVLANSGANATASKPIKSKMVNSKAKIKHQTKKQHAKKATKKRKSSSA